MNLKYISKYIFLTLALITKLTVASEDFSFDALNDISFDFDTSTTEKGMNLDSLDSLVTEITPDDLSFRRSCSAGQAGNLVGIINLFNLSPLLNAAVYKKTLIPFSRNLINYPNMQIVTYSDIADRQFTTHIFGNFTPKKNYCNSTTFKPGTRIGSYLNIENKEFSYLYNNLEKNLPGVIPYLRLNELLQTLGNARFEERRLGLFGHYYHRINDKTYFQAKLPVFWMERNINFSNDEKDFLGRQFAFLKTNSGSGESFDENAFAKKHLIFDSLGIGTLELTANRIIWDGINWTLDVGGGLLIPTDYQISRGWYGTYFKPNDCQPVLNFCDIVNVSNPFKPDLQPDGQEILNKYFTGALNKLSSILLQCQHGYNKHLGIALNAHAFWQIKPDFSWNTKYCGEFLLPHEDQLFFVPKNTGEFSKEFNALPQSTEEEQIAKLNFFETRITELLYPRMFTVKVFPGFIFNSVSCLQKSFRNWNFTVGTSSYYQTSQKILGGLTREQRAIYDLDKAVNESLYHFKLLGKIHRVFHTRHHNDFSISIWADGTVWDNGLGNDLSIGFSFDSKF